MKTISIPSAEIYYEKKFLSAEEANAAFELVRAKCTWEGAGHRSNLPYYSTRHITATLGRNYTYSRREYRPLAWFPEMVFLKARVEGATPDSGYANPHLPKLSYNAALCNLYRNGNDRMGLHADAEPKMGPIIVSASLGAPNVYFG